MNLSEILPKPTDRMISYGMTGSGKTTLAKFLIYQLHAERKSPVLIFDWKGLIGVRGYDKTWPKFERFTILKKLIDKNPKLGIYAPDISENDNPIFWNMFFKYCYMRSKRSPNGLIVYVDEVYACTRNNQIPHYYAACITRGRQQGLQLFSSTQRPMDIPQMVMSESEHRYIFRLQMKQDRQKVESMTGVEAEKIEGLRKRYFYYANDEGLIKGELTLNIK